MNSSRLISAFRIEFRRKGATYQQERRAVQWIQRYLIRFNIDHSSQLRFWQCDFFISELNNEEFSIDDLLQAKSAIRFLMKQVLGRTEREEQEFDAKSTSYMIRITA